MTRFTSTATWHQVTRDFYKGDNNNKLIELHIFVRQDRLLFRTTLRRPWMWDTALTLDVIPGQSITMPQVDKCRHWPNSPPNATSQSKYK